MSVFLPFVPCMIIGIRKLSGTNLYASIKIKIVGHEEVIKKNEFLKSLMYILK